jgi:glyoxylase-like metal-dependent hydrolase (beta-lactamase superfamily II)
MPTDSLAARWNEGAADCKAHPPAPLDVHAIGADTYILRESLCATSEAPFMYLLIGSARAMLIDDGDVEDSATVPLARTVLSLLPGSGASRLPLLVVHTHRHLDHRAGDTQFVHTPNVEVVGYDTASVRHFYHFTDWPNGVTQIELGARTVDVMPTPGHNETHVSFYDRNTTLFFSGDFMMPARLLIDDAGAERATADRVAAFVRDRPVRAVLGGHIELDTTGETFSWGSHYHPGELALAMTKADLLALPAAAESFNGFYTRSGPYLMINSVRVLVAEGLALFAVLVTLVVVVVVLVRRRKARRVALGGTATGAPPPPQTA